MPSLYDEDVITQDVITVPTLDYHPQSRFDCATLTTGSVSSCIGFYGCKNIEQSTDVLTAFP